MTDLRPLMGQRRRSAIEGALALFVPPERKLDYSGAESIRSRYACGASAALLAREYGVSHPTIRKVLNGRIYETPPPMPWRETPTWLANVIPPARISLKQGVGAAQLMNVMKPLMTQRRAQQITGRSVRGHTKPDHRRKWSRAELNRRPRSRCEGFYRFSRRFGLASRVRAGG
jgi:hypothetical protein